LTKHPFLSNFWDISKKSCLFW